jgi:L-threonylcarbamoyladenylate synthase
VLAGFAAARTGRPAGVAAPSANKFGRVSPTSAQHVRDEFGNTVACVLDGGDCEVGIESTIVDLSGAEPRVLRPGRITREQVEAVLGRSLDPGRIARDAPRHSGGLDAHYAPRTPTRVVVAAELEAVLASHGAARCAVLGTGTAPAGVAAVVVLPAEAQGYAHALYAALRDLDASGAKMILVEQPPQGVDWEGVNDRLRRAATGSGI